MKYSTKNPRPLPPLDVLNEWFSYNSETGTLTWKKVKDMDRRSKVGEDAGSLNKESGYSSVMLGGTSYKKHRICYYMGTGEQPFHVDHINGERDDNRSANLRSVDHEANNRNAKKRFDNSSGMVGVSYHKPSGKWRAILSNTHLGTYTDKIDAIYARYWAEQDAGYHENHGR